MRIVLCFLLVLVAAPAWAEWVKVAVTDSYVKYIQIPVSGKDGNLRKVWGIVDLKVRDSKGVMSMRGLDEFDCKKRRSRLLQISLHSEGMARGRAIDSQNLQNQPWDDIAPETTEELILKFVCAK